MRESLAPSAGNTWKRTQRGVTVPPVTCAGTLCKASTASILSA